MPHVEFFAITCVSVLNAPFLGLRLPPISPVVWATAKGELTSASTTTVASTHLTLPSLPLKGLIRLSTAEPPHSASREAAQGLKNPDRSLGFGQACNCRGNVRSM